MASFAPHFPSGKRIILTFNDDDRTSHALTPPHSPLALRFAGWRTGPPDPALALSPRPCPHLFLSVLLAALPDPRPHWPARHPARRTIPRRSGAGPWPGTLLVRAHAALVLVRLGNAARALLDRHRRFRRRAPEPVAA